MMGFVGRAGIKTDAQLANNLLETAISLKTIMVDGRIPRYTRTSWTEELCPIPGNREAALASEQTASQSTVDCSLAFEKPIQQN